MLLARVVVWMFSLAMMVLAAGVVSGQNYPNKPIRIVTSGVGGGSDFTARVVAQGISGPLGQPVIVDNRPSGAIQAGILSNAPPDGYTLLVAGAALWTFPLLEKQMSYDPLRDFSPISILESSPNVLVVHPSLPVKSVKELIALANARPGVLNYASGVTGGTLHLAAELFKAMAGVNIVRISYKSTGPAVNDLLGGQVQLIFVSVAWMAPHVKAGRLRALAVTSAQPSALLPGLPTVAASVPGYEAAGITGMFAPAKTPAAIINRLNQEIVRVINVADVKEKFFNTGSETVGSPPELLAATMKAEMGRLGKLIKDGNITAD